MDRWERDLVAPVVARCIDRFADRGRADLVRELTFPFPLEVIAGMLGLPAPTCRASTGSPSSSSASRSTSSAGMNASQLLRDYFADVLALRRANPGEDLVSVLATAELDGQRLTDDEIFAFLRLLLPAGAETTYRSSSNLLYGLLTNPEQLERLRNDRSLMKRAIEEGLRWEAPLTRSPARRRRTSSSTASPCQRAPSSASASAPRTTTRSAGTTPSASISSASRSSTWRSRTVRTRASACTSRAWRRVS
jgi:cytochrome P450